MEKSPEQWYSENARLMQKAADGDREAFDCLFQRFDPLLMHLFVKWGVNPDSAEDLALKIFERLWGRRKSYRLGYSLEAFLYGIAKNIFHEEMRKSHKINGTRSKRRPVSDEGKYNDLSQPEAELSLKELTEFLEGSKSKLANKQYQALQIAQNPDIDFNRALEDLGWSVETYKWHLKQVRKKIWGNLPPIFLENLNHKKRLKRP